MVVERNLSSVCTTLRTMNQSRGDAIHGHNELTQTQLRNDVRMQAKRPRDLEDELAQPVHALDAPVKLVLAEDVQGHERRVVLDRKANEPELLREEGL